MSDCWDGFKNYLLLKKQLSSKSVEAYIRQVRFFYDQFPEFNRTNFESYVIKSRETNKPSYCKLQYIALGIYAGYLVETKQLDCNFVSEYHKPRIEQKSEPRITTEEIIKIINYTRPSDRSNKAYWDEIYKFLAGTGLRVNELCNLQCRHFDLTSDEFLIESSKTHEQRRIPIPEECREYIKHRIDATNPDNFLFSSSTGKKLSDKSIGRDLRARLKGLKFTKHFSVHSFRSYFVSDMLLNGISLKIVQKLAGHKNSITTLTFYARLLTQDEHNAMHQRSLARYLLSPKEKLENYKKQILSLNIQSDLGIKLITEESDSEYVFRIKTI